ncbi:MAG: helicase-associated domain-containing protein [Anaerolineae bacterium]|nr:helicase-associated domain-containing protein [Anaerolineae bacterium]
MSRGERDAQPMTLKESLENYTVPPLKKLAGLLATNLPTRKADLVSLIQRELENPERLRQLWGQIDTLQQAAVAEAVHTTGNFEADVFRAKYGGAPDWGEKSRYGELKKPSLLCLFIQHGSLMPRDLKRRLQAFVPPPRPPEARAGDEPPATVSQTYNVYDYESRQSKQYTEEVEVVRCETEHAAQHDVHAVLRLIDAGKVRASDRTKRVTAAGAKAITKILKGGDFYPSEEDSDEWTTAPGPLKAFAWPLILQNAGLAELAGTKLQLTSAGKKALLTSPHEVIRKCWTRWLKSTLLDEFNRVHAIKGQTRRRALTPAAGRREVIAKAMRACPTHKWIALDELSRFMRASGFKFEVARDSWALYITDPNYGSLGYEGYGGWHILQERYMMAFLFEYAATLGLVDVAYIHPSGARSDYGRMWGTDDLDCLSRYDGLLYLRVNGLGAWCLGLTQEYTPSPLEKREALKVLPTMEIVATETLPPGDTLILEQFAEQTSDAVWRIDQARLLEAVEQGHATDRMEAFLRARSDSEIPDNVRVFFREAADRASRLADLGAARLIEAQDAALAQLIANDSTLRSLCMLAGERHIVVPEENEAAFRRALHNLGYGLPKRPTSE